ncbi:MAG: TonB-dependent receptor family protein [Bacteroidia bacterium]|nr:TonB-dependent receptor family protein [Bacteroidia bacterium]MCX7764782.1 TonB-dependent receptor family protein [Bacteroidia bacterium]MDW8057809.1 TonB-dependent receptor [Bacteroidia bacterium]
MKRQLTLIIVGLLWAQPPGGRREIPGGREMAPRPEAALKGTIRGILKDSATKEPLPYVSVSLYRGDKLIAGGLSDEKGAFTLQEVPIGRYKLRVQPLGYAPTEKLIETTPLRPDLNLGTIFLSEVGVELQAVEIQAERSPIEYQPEKIVYSPEKDPTLQGGDAIDVLRKIPAVNVDLDGNIQVRGSGAIRIYVDGKPSLLFANNPGDALRAIPADQIDRIELITNPSARYEAEGAVILNIVLKRNRLEGITLSANAGISNQFANGSLTAGVKVGRWSHTLNIGGRYRYAGVGYTRFYRRQETITGPVELRQNGEFLPKRFATNLFYGGEYVRNAEQTFSWGINARQLSFLRTNDLTVSWTGGAFDGMSYVRKARFPSEDIGANANFDFTYRPAARPGEELFLSLQGGYGWREQRYFLDQLSELDTFFLRERSRNLGPSWEGQFQADYTRPFAERWKLETGLRLNLRGVGTGFSYERYDPSQEAFQLLPQRQDTLTYTQWVPAAYASIAWSKDRWLLKGGLRYEYTYNDALFLRGTMPFHQSYQNLFPNVLVSYSIRGLFPLQLSYSQRIRRPWIQEINPFVDASDPRNIQYGNPYLGPELTHSVELGFFPFITLYMRQTRDAVQEYTFVDAAGVTNTTFLNAGQRWVYGTNIFFRRSFFSDKLTLQGSGELEWVSLQADLGRGPIKNSGWQYSVRGSLQWRPAPSWIAELSGNYNSPRISLQGLRPVFMFQELGVRKNFANGRWSVGAILYNPFYTYLRFYTRLQGPNFFQENVTGVPFRLFGVQVRYQQTKAGENFWRRRRSPLQNADEEERW